MERKFLIKEWDGEWQSEEYTITESELNRRLRRIMEPHSDLRDWHTLREAQHILLQGVSDDQGRD